MRLIVAINETHFDGQALERIAPSREFMLQIQVKPRLPLLRLSGAKSSDAKR
jgi:hypothetical protein